MFHLSRVVMILQLDIGLYVFDIEDYTYLSIRGMYNESAVGHFHLIFCFPTVIIKVGLHDQMQGHQHCF